MPYQMRSLPSESRFILWHVFIFALWSSRNEWTEGGEADGNVGQFPHTVRAVFVLGGNLVAFFPPALGCHHGDGWCTRFEGASWPCACGRGGWRGLRWGFGLCGFCLCVRVVCVSVCLFARACVSACVCACAVVESDSMIASLAEQKSSPRGHTPGTYRATSIGGKTNKNCVLCVVCGMCVVCAWYVCRLFVRLREACVCFAIPWCTPG